MQKVIDMKKLYFLNSFIAFFLLLIVSSNINTCHAYSDLSFSINEKIDHNRFFCKALYEDLLTQNKLATFFKEHDINEEEFFFITNPSSGLSGQAIFLLYLLEWLQKQQNEESQLFLKRISKLFCLEMHRFISSMELPKDKHGEVWAAFHKLYHHTVSNRSIINKHTFRTTLAKSIITILIIGFDKGNHAAKQESLAYALEKTRKELEKINTTLPNPVEIGNINTLITSLENYALTEPLIKPRAIYKTAIKWGTIISLIAISSYVSYKYVDWAWLWETIREKIRDFAEAAGKALGIGMFDAAADAILNERRPNEGAYREEQRKRWEKAAQRVTGVTHGAVETGITRAEKALTDVKDLLNQTKEMAITTTKAFDAISEKRLNELNKTIEQATQGVLVNAVVVGPARAAGSGVSRAAGAVANSAQWLKKKVVGSTPEPALPGADGE